MRKEDIKTLTWVGIWGIAFGFVEAAVVFYQRKLYFPDDVLFPLSAGVPFNVFLVECSREAATIIMLLGIGLVAGARSKQRLAYFLYSFAVWDIFYYVGLKVLLNWPASLFTWDILFLIPVVWASPVLAPVVVSIDMIFLAVLMVRFSPIRPDRREWGLLLFSSVLVYLTFIWDYSRLVLNFGPTGPQLAKAISTYVPSVYHWDIFVIAQGVALFALVRYYQRSRVTSLAVRSFPSEC